MAQTVGQTAPTSGGGLFSKLGQNWKKMRANPNFVPGAVIFGGTVGIITYAYWDNIKSYLQDRQKKSDSSNN